MHKVQNVYLKHFKAKEFRGWTMSTRLLCFLDLFRDRLGLPISVSPVKGAIGRDGEGTSQHFWENWGEVRGIDILPGGLTKANAQNYIELARECGFTGIGIYPHWDPKPGMHLDVRNNNEMALWGAIDNESGQTYVSVAQAIQHWDAKL